jgi:hypothetical protein
MNATRDCMPDVLFSPEQIEQIERDFQDVKERFMIRECSQPDCKGRRLNHTWSKKDFVSMARESDDLYPLLSYGYYLPTREIHSTVGAIFSRLDANALGQDEKLIFDSGSQRARADQAIITAHTILLHILELQRECFNISELEPLLQILVEDFAAMLDRAPEVALTAAGLFSRSLFLRDAGTDGTFSFLSGYHKCARRDSNSRPSGS